MDLWRAVAQGTRIDDIVEVIRSGLGLSFVVVQRWDEVRESLQLVAAVGRLPDHRPPRQSLTSPRTRELRAWAHRGRPQAWPNRSHAALARLLVPEGTDGMFTAIGLTQRGRLIGTLSVDGDRADVALRLAEPIATALVNQIRQVDTARRCAAAEADREALLGRLGRTDIAEAMVGANGGLSAVLVRVTQVARTDLPVWLFGEPGTGKEVVAREVHRRSLRATGPFVRFDCKNVPNALLDDQLFGAAPGPAGAFDRAEGGTLYLDEIDSLPPETQSRLLPGVRDALIHRVGDGAPHGVDVRLIVGTQRDLREAVRDRQFRQDLWYAVSEFPIAIPPLRSHLTDMPNLARHFAERAGRRHYGRPLAPSTADIQLLTAHRWPGNVRELAAVLECAAILGAGDGLDLVGALGRDVDPKHPDPTDLEAVLSRCLGRIEGPFGAAKALGQHPATLRSRLRRLGIAWDVYRS